jgi:hypothetical protein
MTSGVISAHNTAIVNYFQKLVDASRTINTADRLASRWANLIMIYYKFLVVLRIVFVVTAPSSMLLAVTEKHMPRLVMTTHCIIKVGTCKFNTGSVLVLRALSSVFLAVTEKHVPRLVMIIHCLIILME